MEMTSTRAVTAGSAAPAVGAAGMAVIRRAPGGIGIVGRRHAGGATGVAPILGHTPSAPILRLQREACLHQAHVLPKARSSALRCTSFGVLKTRSPYRPDYC